MKNFDDFFDNLSEMFNGSLDSDINFPKDNDKNYNKKVVTKETSTHIIKEETWISIDGSKTFSRTTQTSKTKAKEKELLSKTDLETELKKAIETQDFEKAAKIRDQIKKL